MGTIEQALQSAIVRALALAAVVFEASFCVESRRGARQRWSDLDASGTMVDHHATKTRLLQYQESQRKLSRDPSARQEFGSAAQDHHRQPGSTRLPLLFFDRATSPTPHQVLAGVGQTDDLNQRDPEVGRLDHVVVLQKKQPPCCPLGTEDGQSGGLPLKQEQQCRWP